MLGANDLSIGISLILRDQFTGRAAAASAALHNLDAEAARAQQRQMEMSRNMNAVGAGIGAMAVMGMRQFVMVGAEFDKQATYMYSIAEGKQAKTLKQMKTRAMEVGVETMFSTTEVAKAMTTMAQAGQSIEQIHTNISAVAYLAAATMSSIQSSSSIMNDIMIGFDIKATEDNATQVTDIITRTINDSNIELRDFAESMKYIIPSATSLGISLEHVAGMISVVGNAGIKGSMAGTNLENFLRYAARAAGKKGASKQGKALAMLGLEPGDLINAEGKIMTITEMIPMIGKQLQKMGKYDVKGFNAMMDIFGVRGGRTANLLVNKLAEFDEAIYNVNNSLGITKTTADDVMGTLWGTIEQVDSSWENLKIAFTEAVQPVLQPLLEVVVGIVSALVGMMRTTPGKWLTVLGAGFVIAKTLSMGYKAVVLSIRLGHMAMGSSMATASSQTVSGYNSMTSAAQRYKMAATGAAATGVGRMGGWLSGMGVGRAVYQGKGGTKWVKNKQGGTVRVPNNTPTGWSIGKSGATMAGLGKFGKFAGKASPWAMLGGIGLQAGAQAVGADTGLGKTMSVAGSTLSWAGTGAMLGSVIPGIGTAVGAVVGGVGGLLMSLHDQLAEVEDAVDKAKSEQSSNDIFTSADWINKARGLNSMFSGEWIYGKGWNRNLDDMQGTTRRGHSEHLGLGGVSLNGKYTPNKLIINIDGEQKMDEMIEEGEYVRDINLAF